MHANVALEDIPIVIHPQFASINDYLASIRDKITIGISRRLFLDRDLQLCRYWRENDLLERLEFAWCRFFIDFFLLTYSIRSL